ncbi:hypothetical protein EIP91_002749 [Steccherinum ochraceum]|uniref:Kinesin motor domain-containing protein n=1 Tax=Steccherinum ochraceum TaxID=92696 RepID=A0A4R0RHY7_9APHY|nr:hypothetical protein EIP91_002749 [Steccherinum ochraceum]
MAADPHASTMPPPLDASAAPEEPPTPTFSRDPNTFTTPAHPGRSSKHVGKREDLAKTRKEHGAKMDDRTHHEMPFEDFMKLYAPGEDLPRPVESYYNFQSVPDGVFTGPELDFYPYICQALSSLLDDSHSQSRLEARDTGNWSEKGAGRDTPDISLYPRDSDMSTLHRLTDKEIKESTANPARRPWMSRVVWRLLRAIVEIKTGKKGLAPLEGSTSETSLEARGQIVDYVCRMMRDQPRLFAFAVTIYQRKAYIMRFDPSGVIVAQPFDYTQQPEKLYTFFYRIARMTDAELGFDPTAELLANDDPDVTALRAFEPKRPHHKEHYDYAFKAGLPVYRIKMVDPNGTPHSFLIGRPRHYSRSPFGRFSKGFVAYEPDKKALRWIKDYFRPDVSIINSETDTYLSLKAHKVRNIATFLCGGDVFSYPGDARSLQRTRSQKHIKSSQAARIHHRIVVEEVCRALAQYKQSRELCIAVLGALRAHEDAWTKAQIIHRDVSCDNILIDDDHINEKGAVEVIGILNDWDMCKTKAQLATLQPSQGTRSGTWLFMSAQLLKYPKKPFELADDLESFVHVISWLALRFHYHNFSKNITGLENIVHGYYEIVDSKNGVNYGSESKFMDTRDGRLPFHLLQGSRQAAAPLLQQVLNRLLDLCRAHYSATNFDRMSIYGDPDDVLQPSPSFLEEPLPPLELPGPPRAPADASILFVQPEPTASSDSAPDSISPELNPHGPFCMGPRDLDSHDKMINILEAALAYRWPANDKLDDQFINMLPPHKSGYSRSRTYIPLFSTGSSGTLKVKRKNGDNENSNTGAVKQKTGFDTSVENIAINYRSFTPVSLQPRTAPPMSGRQIKILARIRPSINSEAEDDGLNIVRENGKSYIVVSNPKDPSRTSTFPFTSCYGPDSNQEEIFTNEVDSMIDVVYSGITVTIFAYGVTSSGKTHTMQGSKAQPGIIPRAVEALFARKTANTQVVVSYTEIYKDEVYDLLVERIQAAKLPVRENQQGEVFVANKEIVPIESVEEFNALYSEATKRRSVAATNLNRASSRSHAILTLETKTEADGKLIHGKLNLVDLAGSENNKLTGNDASRMAESAAINKSLSVLGQVVHALNTGASRIPYRNSKLTRILQDALGGSSLGLLICNIAPTLKHRQDTLNTLNFASRAKNIENKLVVNQKDVPVNPKAPAPRSELASKPVQPAPTVGLKPPSRVPRPSVIGTVPLLPLIPEHREVLAQPVLSEKDIDDRIAKAVEAEVARRLAEHELQRQAERERDAELQAQRAAASQRSSVASRPSIGDQPTPSEGGSRSAGEDELRQRLQDLEEKIESGSTETRMVSDLSPVSRKKAGRAYVALARAQSEKNNLNLALELYRKAESYVPDNIKLKERIIEIEWAVKHGKPFNPSPKKPRKKAGKKTKKPASSKGGGGHHTGASAGEYHAGAETDIRQENVGVPLKLSQKRRAEDLQGPDVFATPAKKTKIDPEDIDED